MREEKDSLGTVQVPDDRLWGAHTERSLENFKIGTEKMPLEIIKALIAIKRSAAIANCELNHIENTKKELIVQAIDSLTAEDLLVQFPLSVFQTGSGTQTNMNVNEVIANKANEIAGSGHGTKSPIHPNDDVNRSQSSNDVFPSAMHIAFSLEISNRLLPSLEYFYNALNEKAQSFFPIIKVGRTHMQDAVPIRLGQEFSGYAAQIQYAIESLQRILPRVEELALGGTAVGTGINCPKGFKEKAIEHLSAALHLPFSSARNSFEALSCHDTTVELSGILTRTACALFKIANDIRFMACGPRCGIAELHLPENEPGSSIMPGKINPTQCEAMVQVACQVIGNSTAITVAATQGQLELSTFKPIIAKNCLQSIHLLSDVCMNFTDKCLKGIEADIDRIKFLLDRSLMLATGLSTAIGYDKAAKVALLAARENITLREAAEKLGVDPILFKESTDPNTMV